MKSGFPAAKPCAREIRALGRVKAERLPRCQRGDGVSYGVEVRPSTIAHRRDELRRSEEVHRLPIPVVAAWEVAVVTREDRVVFTFRDAVRATPLPNTRAACIGQHHPACLLERPQRPVAGYGGADLLGAGCDEEVGFGLEAGGGGLLDEGFGTRHVFVGGVGAGSYQAGAEGLGPGVRFDGVFEEGEGGAEVGGEGAVDVGFEL